jgi:hypothetical protein
VRTGGRGAKAEIILLTLLAAGYVRTGGRGAKAEILLLKLLAAGYVRTGGRGAKAGILLLTLLAAGYVRTGGRGGQSKFSTSDTACCWLRVHRWTRRPKQCSTACARLRTWWRRTQAWRSRCAFLNLSAAIFIRFSGRTTYISRTW